MASTPTRIALISAHGHRHLGLQKYHHAPRHPPPPGPVPAALSHQCANLHHASQAAISPWSRRTARYEAFPPLRPAQQLRPSRPVRPQLGAFVLDSA